MSWAKTYLRGSQGLISALYKGDPLSFWAVGGQQLHLESLRALPKEQSVLQIPRKVLRGTAQPRASQHCVLYASLKNLVVVSPQHKSITIATWFSAEIALGIIKFCSLVDF